MGCLSPSGADTGDSFIEELGSLLEVFEAVIGVEDGFISGARERVEVLIDTWWICGRARGTMPKRPNRRADCLYISMTKMRILNCY